MLCIFYVYVGEQWGIFFQNLVFGDWLEVCNFVGVQIDWEYGDMMGSFYGSNLIDKCYFLVVGFGLCYVGVLCQFGVCVIKFF